MKSAFKFLTHTLFALAALAFAFVAGGCDKTENEAGGASKFEISGISGSTIKFALGEKKSYPFEAVNISQTSIDKPAGWSVDLNFDTKTLVVTAPKVLTGASASGEVVIKYTGTDGVSNKAVIRVETDATIEPEPDPEPDPTPDIKGSFEIQTQVSGTSISFYITPDDINGKFWIGLDAENHFKQFNTVNEYIADDIAYWKQQYGDAFASSLASGPVADKFSNVDVAGTYIVYAYYVNDDLATGYGFSMTTVVISDSGTAEPVEPALNLQCHIGDGAQFGYDGKGVVVAFIEPTDNVTDWYYGSFRAEVANSMTDDEVRASLKQYEQLHGQNVEVYPYDWQTKIVLCGFYIDANGNEGPIERVAVTVSLTGDATYNYGDYLGEWTVSGKNAAGNEVSWDISIEENMYNESYKIFGFTRTGKDRTYNAPVRANYTNGAIEFYENSLLGIDQESQNFLGFLGFAYEVGKPDNVGYFNIDHQVIARGVRANNTIAIDWQQFTWNGDGNEHKLQYYAFAYGYLTEDEIRNQYFYQYDEDLQTYIVSDITITKKHVPAKSLRKTFVKRGIAKR